MSTHFSQLPYSSAHYENSVTLNTAFYYTKFGKKKCYKLMNINFSPFLGKLITRYSPNNLGYPHQVNSIVVSRYASQTYIRLTNHRRISYCYAQLQCTHLHKKSTTTSTAQCLLSSSYSCKLRYNDLPVLAPLCAVLFSHTPRVILVDELCTVIVHLTIFLLVLSSKLETDRKSFSIYGRNRNWHRK